MAQKSTSKCSLCGVNNSIYFCYECRKALCRSCRTPHDNIPASKNHTVTDLKSVDRTAFQNLSNCTVHNIDYTLYCTQCKVMICGKCVTKHNRHDISHIDQFVDEMRKEAEIKVEKMGEKLSKSSMIISRVEKENLPEIENQAKFILNEIELARKDIHQVIDAISDVKITEIEDFETLEKEQLKRNLVNRKQIHFRCFNLHSTLQQLLLEKHAITFLNAYKNLKGDFMEFQDLELGPTEIQRPPHFEKKLLVGDLIQTLTTQYELSKSAQDTNKEQITRLTNENERLKLTEKQLKEVLEKKEKEIKKMEEAHNVTKAEKASVQSLLDEICSKKKTSTKAPDQKFKDLQEENEKLRDRPTQLGEKFSEVYDNEWTDAMEELSNTGDEKSNITTLRNIVEKSYEFAVVKANRYAERLECAMLEISSSIEITPAISKCIKDHRQSTAFGVLDSLFKGFLRTHTEFNIGGKDVQTFIKKTLSLCWMMTIQDPPVILTTELSGKFNTDLFRHYSKSGSKVDYVVWPVVFLHFGGPIICKGVAQGK